MATGISTQTKFCYEVDGIPPGHCREVTAMKYRYNAPGSYTSRAVRHTAGDALVATPPPVSRKPVQRLLLKKKKIKKRFFYTMLLYVGFGLLVFTFRWYHGTYVPIKEPFATLPDPAKMDSVDEAMQQTTRLVAALKANDWDPFRVPHALIMLPDAKYAQYNNLNDPLAGSFVFPILQKEPDSPVQDKIAVYSEVYVRTNTKIFKNDRATFAPSGFFVVGWKDGRVEKVPIGDVRYVKMGKYYTAVFPGMNAWKADGIRNNFIEFANGFDNARPEAREFYKPTTDPECESCKVPAT